MRFSANLKRKEERKIIRKKQKTKQKNKKKTKNNNNNNNNNTRTFDISMKHFCDTKFENGFNTLKIITGARSQVNKLQ